MNKDKLKGNLRIFHNQMEERLKELSPEEQQQYLEGLVHAFDAMTRYANPTDITPLEQQNFIDSAKSWAYSRAYHLGLDPEKYMRGLIESSGEHTVKSYAVAVKLQELLGLPIDIEERMGLVNVAAVVELEKMDKKEEIDDVPVL